MTRRVPVVATLVVALAVATMIALGFWQLGRMGEKEAVLDRYARATLESSPVAWPAGRAGFDRSLYRRAQVDCLSVRRIDPIAGHSASGETGWAHMATCSLADGGTAQVALGWSREPRSPVWRGGPVAGVIGPQGDGIKLVASPPLAGLAALALPDPRDLPNNHLSYAVQWFLFAATALVIYALALRSRWRAKAG